MDAFALGPLAIPVRVALPLLAILAATLLAGFLHRRAGRGGGRGGGRDGGEGSGEGSGGAHPAVGTGTDTDAGPLLWKMVATGFVTARAVFVLRHHDLYFHAPWTVLDVRDGGFEASAGLVAACVVGAELTRRRARLRRPLLACILAGCAVWFGGALALQALAPAPAGTPLPDLMVRTLDGREVPLRGFAGRPVVVNLWATWCPPCRREMPALQAAQAANPDLHVVFINVREPAGVVERYLAGHRLALRNVVLDPAGRVATQLGAAGYPTTLFFDAAGRLQLRHMGELSPASLRDKLDRLRPGRPHPAR